MEDEWKMNRTQGEDANGMLSHTLDASAEYIIFCAILYVWQEVYVCNVNYEFSLLHEAQWQL
jgi:hypothetical protein